MTLNALLTKLQEDKHSHVFFTGSAIKGLHKDRYEGKKIHREESISVILNVHKSYCVSNIHFDTNTVDLINIDGFVFENISLDDITFDNRHEKDKFIVVNYPISSESHVTFKVNDIAKRSPRPSKIILKTADEAVKLVDRNSIIVPQFILSSNVSDGDIDMLLPVKLTGENINRLMLEKPAYQKMHDQLNAEVMEGFYEYILEELREKHSDIHK